MSMSNTKLWAITLLGIAIGWVLFKAAPALQPALIAIVIAYLLNPLVEQIEKRLRVKKWLAITLLLAVVVAFLISLGNLIFTQVANQATEFVKDFQTISVNFKNLVEDIFAFLQKWGLSQNILQDMRQYVEQAMTLLGGYLVSVITSSLGYIFKVVDLVLILIMVIYFLASGKKMVASIVDYMPGTLRQTALNLVEGTDRVVWSYIKTQVIIALIVGLLSTITFILIGVKYSVLLGVAAGILNFIPYFGSIIAGALATLIALLTDGFRQAIMTLIAVLVIQQVEGNFITPRLQGKSTGLHPVVILIVILVGNYLWGTMGMFIAVPLFGLARLFIDEAVKQIKQID
ncbi:MAG: AI-2 transport protein TqsA [Pelotomaculum sp. PtaB.Bin104]|nr:MAG: AI-2 transport protein TqsA [Pelotomaculum sp. PtaB.Bin104]